MLPDPAASLKKPSLIKLYLLSWKKTPQSSLTVGKNWVHSLTVATNASQTFLGGAFFMQRREQFLPSVFHFFECSNREAGCKVSDSHLNWNWAKTTTGFQILLWIINIHQKAFGIRRLKAGFGQQSWKVFYSTVRFCQLSCLNELEIYPNNFLNCLGIEVSMHGNIIYL